MPFFTPSLAISFCIDHLIISSWIVWTLCVFGTDFGSNRCALCTFEHRLLICLFIFIFCWFLALFSRLLWGYPFMSVWSHHLFTDVSFAADSYQISGRFGVRSSGGVTIPILTGTAAIISIFSIYLLIDVLRKCLWARPLPLAFFRLHSRLLIFFPFINTLFFLDCVEPLHHEILFGLFLLFIFFCIVEDLVDFIDVLVRGDCWFRDRIVGEFGFEGLLGAFSWRVHL